MTEGYYILHHLLVFIHHRKWSLRQITRVVILGSVRVSHQNHRLFHLGPPNMSCTHRCPSWPQLLLGRRLNGGGYGSRSLDPWVKPKHVCRMICKRCCIRLIGWRGVECRVVHSWRIGYLSLHVEKQWKTYTHSSHKCHFKWSQNWLKWKMSPVSPLNNWFHLHIFRDETTRKPTGNPYHLVYHIDPRPGYFPKIEKSTLWWFQPWKTIGHMRNFLHIEMNQASNITTFGCDPTEIMASTSARSDALVSSCNAKHPWPRNDWQI